MSPPTRLFLLRHGEVEAAYQKVFGGRLDMGLSPRGEEQARRLAAEVRPIRFEALLVSPLRRAQQTAAALAANNGYAPVTIADLREVDFGAWTGLSWDQVREQYGVSPYRWLDELEAGRIKGAESVSALGRRVDACLREVLTQYKGATVALVCHGGVIRMALARLLELPLSKMAAFEIDYGSVTVVDVAPGKVEVQLLNFTPWRTFA